MFSLQNADSGDLLEFYAHIYGACVSFIGVPFILCYYSEQITQNLLKIQTMAYDDVSWYRLKPKFRPYVMLLIQRAQQPVQITGFGIVGCTLTDFSDVSIGAV